MTRIDWSKGPVACAGCGVMMRPAGAASTGPWEGTVMFAGHRMCHRCKQYEYRSKRKTAASKLRAQSGASKETLAARQAQFERNQRAHADATKASHTVGLTVYRRPGRAGQMATMRVHYRSLSKRDAARACWRLMLEQLADRDLAPARGCTPTTEFPGDGWVAVTVQVQPAPVGAVAA